MLNWKHLGAFIRLFAALCFMASAQAADYAKATRHGKAHLPSCGSGFTDVLGDCWKCPSGYKHDNILLTPDDPKVCKKEGRRIKRKGTVVGSSTAGICSSGWVSTDDWKCYKCDRGFTHDHSKYGSESGVCFKDEDDEYSRASRMGGDLLCDEGFLDSIDGGTCWSCPKDFPIRSAFAVDGDRACQKSLTTLPPLPNLDPLVAQCKLTVASLKAGKVPDVFKPVLAAVGVKPLPDSKKLLAEVEKQVKRFEPLVPEIKRVHKAANGEKKVMMSLFDADVFCDPSALKAKLDAVAPRPNFPAIINSLTPKGHFFMAYTLAFSLAAGAGVQGGYAIVTDYGQNTGAFVFLGPQIVSNLSLGDSIGVQFFPLVEFSDFTGWGLSAAVSGGPPTKVFGAGLDVSFSTTAVFQGVGISGGIGLGALPADFGVAATHSWKMF